MIPTFVINLDRSKERWTRMQKALEDAGFPSNSYQRFSAVEGKKLDRDYIKSILSVRAFFDLNKPRYEHRMFNNLGAIGCYLSHIKLAQHIVENQIPMALILEDDGIPNKDAMEKLQKLKLPEDGDMYILSAAFLPNGMIQSYDDNWYRLYNMFFGTQAYLLTFKGAQKILQKAFPIEVQVDAFIGMLSSLPDNYFKLYALKIAESKSKAPFRFGGVKSTVQVDRNIFENPFLANHVKDFSPSRPWANIPMCVNVGLFLVLLFLFAYLLILKNSPF